MAMRNRAASLRLVRSSCGGGPKDFWNSAAVFPGALMSSLRAIGSLSSDVQRWTDIPAPPPRLGGSWVALLEVEVPMPCYRSLVDRRCFDFIHWNRATSA